MKIPNMAPGAPAHLPVSPVHCDGHWGVYNVAYDSALAQRVLRAMLGHTSPADRPAVTLPQYLHTLSPHIAELVATREMIRHFGRTYGRASGGAL